MWVVKGASPQGTWHPRDLLDAPPSASCFRKTRRQKRESVTKFAWQMKTWFAGRVHLTRHYFGFISVLRYVIYILYFCIFLPPPFHSFIFLPSSFTSSFFFHLVFVIFCFFLPPPFLYIFLSTSLPSSFNIPFYLNFPSSSISFFHLSSFVIRIFLLFPSSRLISVIFCFFLPPPFLHSFFIVLLFTSLPASFMILFYLSFLSI